MNWCFWTVVLEKTLESPVDCKKIQPVHLKGNQSWIFIGRIDAEAETPIIWPPHAKSWLIGKDSDAGRDWGQEEKGTTEDEMTGWHHRFNAHEFGWTPGVGDGQGGLACCDSWGHKESDTTEWLNWTELNWMLYILKIVLEGRISYILTFACQCQSLPTSNIIKCNHFNVPFKPFYDLTLFIIIIIITIIIIILAFTFLFC